MSTLVIKSIYNLAIFKDRLDKSLEESFQKGGIQDGIDQELEYIGSVVDGTVAPCCFMVDKSLVKDKEEIKEMFDKKVVLVCCGQCGELLRGEN